MDNITEERPLPHIDSGSKRNSPSDLPGRISEWRHQRKTTMENAELEKHIRLIDLFTPEGEFDSKNFAEFERSTGSRGTIGAIVHPLFYGESELLSMSNTLSSEYIKYTDKLAKLLADLKKQNIPIVLFLESSFIKTEHKWDENGFIRPGKYREKIDIQKKALRKSLATFLGFTEGNIFVVLTRPQSPAPLISSNLYDEIVFNPDDFASKHEVQRFLKNIPSITYASNPGSGVRELNDGTDHFALHALIAQMQKHGLKKVLLAGSYCGGQIEGKEMTGGDEVETIRNIPKGGKLERIKEMTGQQDIEGIVTAYQEKLPVTQFTVVSTGKKFLARPGSQFYFPAGRDGEKNSVWFRLMNEEEKNPNAPTHPLNTISLRGCPAFFMRHLTQQGITVGIANTTFPEQLPKTSQLALVQDPEGNEYYVDSSRIKSFPF